MRSGRGVVVNKRKMSVWGPVMMKKPGGHRNQPWRERDVVVDQGNVVGDVRNAFLWAMTARRPPRAVARAGEEYWVRAEPRASDGERRGRARR